MTATPASPVPASLLDDLLSGSPQRLKTAVARLWVEHSSLEARVFAEALRKGDSVTRFRLLQTVGTSTITQLDRRGMWALNKALREVLNDKDDPTAREARDRLILFPLPLEIAAYPDLLRFTRKDLGGEMNPSVATRATDIAINLIHQPSLHARVVCALARSDLMKTEDDVLYACLRRGVFLQGVDTFDALLDRAIARRASLRARSLSAPEAALPSARRRAPQL